MSNLSPNVTSPTSKIPQANQHVNFLQGMVLGEDDFRQEFAYLSGRDQWLARDLLGYGTACGLKISVAQDSDGTQPRVIVASGVALDPQGQLIRVDPPQCAYLNQWLGEAAVQAAIPDRLVSQSPLGDTITLYLTLCYRECLTDSRPLPGEPCRVQEEIDLLKPARVQDDFVLELCWQPPEQQEEDALRDFVAWLRQVKVTEIVPGDPEQHLQDFLEAVRNATYLLASPPGSPPSPPDFLYDSPPVGLAIPGSQACEYLRLAFKTWATELRPLWSGRGEACGSAPNEKCVLLAALHIPVEQTVSGWVVNTAEFTAENVIDESRRPYLIHLRLVQEWLTCGRNALLVPSDTVQAEQTYNLPDDPGDAELYSRADHTHGSPSDVLTGDVTGTFGDNTVTALQDVPLVTSSPVTLEAGEVLALEQTGDGQVWAPTPIAGDVIGPVENTTVVALQDVPLAASSPVTLEAGEVLALEQTGDGQVWAPTPIAGDVIGPVENTTVVALQDVPLAASSPVTLEAGEVLALRQAAEGLEWTPTRLDGEVSGPVEATRVASIQTLPVDQASPADPSAGQVLMLQRIGRRRAWQWRASDLPAAEPLPLSGDVGGTTDNNHLDLLQGSPLAIPSSITAGHVLTFQNGQWEPAPPTGGSGGDLDGDVINAPNDNLIRSLQRHLVEAESPADGDILRFEEEPAEGEPHWINKPPAFVLRPDHTQQPERPPVGPYSIEAAGVIEFEIGEETTDSNAFMVSSYNGLQVEVVEANITQGKLHLRFDDYQFSELPIYIVKLTPWPDPEKSDFFSTHISALDQEGILVEVLVFGGDLNTLSGRVMVEISRFEPDPR